MACQAVIKHGPNKGTICGRKVNLDDSSGLYCGLYCGLHCGLHQQTLQIDALCQINKDGYFVTSSGLDALRGINYNRKMSDQQDLLNCPISRAQWNGKIHPYQADMIASIVIDMGFFSAVDPYAGNGYVGTIFTSVGLPTFSYDIKSHSDATLMDEPWHKKWLQLTDDGMNPALILCWPDPPPSNNGIKTLHIVDPKLVILGTSPDYMHACHKDLNAYLKLKYNVINHPPIVNNDGIAIWQLWVHKGT